MILLSHPTGNANVRGTLGALASAGKLRAFYTAVAHDPAVWWAQWLPLQVRRELERRSYPLERGVVRTHGLREYVRLAAGRLGFSNLARHEVGWACVDSVYRDLDRHVARSLSRYGDLHAVYAYEDGALATFRGAKQAGLRCMYELPIGYWKYARNLLSEEAHLQPLWASTLTGNRDSDEKLARKDEELALADVIYVASTFTRHTLGSAAVGDTPIHVIPYGSPDCVEKTATGTHPGTKLRVIFVGALGQRKGLSYLLDAVQALGSAVELTLVGTVPAEPCKALEDALQLHRHISSLSHGRVLEEMRRHDVLIFPSLFEGFGLVLLEAMAQGLPVITTPHTAGPDLITDGKEGFLVPIRSSEAIAEKLDLLRSDRSRLQEMGSHALSRARQTSWKSYASQLLDTL